MVIVKRPTFGLSVASHNTPRLLCKQNKSQVNNVFVKAFLAKTNDIAAEAKVDLDETKSNKVLYSH